MTPETDSRDTAQPLVLLVEDDAFVRKALTFALTIEGFRVEVHESAETLLARDAAPTAACVVFDQNLPGTQGVDALALLRERGLDCPAIVITTQPKPEVRALAAQLGAQILEKPLLGGHLPAAIRELLSH